MQDAICHLAQIPVRATPADSAEIVTFALFGERLKILEHTEKWLRIELLSDSYQGWMDVKQCLFCEDTLPDTTYLTQDLLTQAIKIRNGEMFYLPMGSELHKWDGSTCQIATEKYIVNGNVQIPTKPYDTLQIENLARKFLSTPYLWGGKTAMGIDCSGFTQMVYKMFNVNLFRDASMQVLQGVELPNLSEAKKGDIAFFKNLEGKIIHVGILLSQSEIIHASGCVKIDSIDSQGIFNQSLGTYTHQLATIKSIV